MRSAEFCADVGYDCSLRWRLE